MLCVTPHSQISADVISSLRVGRFKGNPPSLLPPTHRPHPPASPFPSPSLQKAESSPIQAAVFGFCDVRLFVVWPAETTREMMSVGCPVTAFCQSLREQVVSKTSPPPPHFFLPLISFSSSPSFHFFLSFFFFGSVTSNWCFSGSRDDLRDDISVSAERLLHLNCNLKGQTQGGREGGRERCA